MVRIFPEDVVLSKNPSKPGSGIVIRCWHDDNSQSLSSDTFPEIFQCKLEKGQVGVALFPTDGAPQNSQVLLESELELVDRNFHIGDCCKRNIHDVNSGVIVDLKMEFKLEHVISGAQIQDWVNMSEINISLDLEVGDYVSVDDWIGQVLEVFDEAIVEVTSGQLVRLPEFGSRLSVGDKGPNILPGGATSTSPLRLIMGASRKEDTVLNIQHTVYAITWLAINQSLDPTVAQTRSRPQRFWTGESIKKLTLIRGKTDQYCRIGDRVVFKDHGNHPSTKHGKSELEVKTFVIKNSRTTATVLWQDGTSSTAVSTSLIPYMNPDEYDSWPGDHVLVTGEDGTKRAAVVQAVSDRTARVLLGDGTFDVVSVLEVDAHGSASPDPNLGMELGVRRGDYVFIHHHNTNGQSVPWVPILGELESWTREQAPLQELSAWRRDMIQIGSVQAAKHGITYQGTPLGCRVRPPPLDTFHWFGEVIDLRLDGSVLISHPEGSEGVYSIDRITRLNDGIEQLENEAWDHPDDDNLDIDDPMDTSWYMDGEEEDESSSDESMESTHSAADKPSEDHDRTPKTYTDSKVPTLVPPTPEPTAPISLPTLQVDKADGEIERFEVLSAAPPDHAFISTVPLQHSRNFLSRITREYRGLIDGLPESILVRAYEDRTDLLRSVIIGPEDTPYENAPFVIDWMLDSNFPNSPPIAHFHSWTAGKGRINPNLYEEGKVCLSILGTWTGDRTESWNAARSSLLQALVSIQGLVLVKEPWFCEPAYEKLRGTEDAVVNSRLYSEKAYVLSHSFVRQAIETPVVGFKEEIEILYLRQGRLEKIIQKASALIERSKSGTELTAEEVAEAPVPRLSSGGILSLTRILTRLQSLLDSSRAST